MEKKIPVSEVRQKLPQLLKKLQKNPNEIVRITVHGAVVGELRASRLPSSQLNPGSALLQAMKKVGKPTETYPKGKRVAADHDEFLYG